MREGEPELGVLPAPSGRRISQICDSDATGQAPVYCGPHQVRSQERERYRHIDLTDGATTLVPNARRDLFEAMKQVAETGHGPANQTPSMGCSIKWKD